MNFDKFPDPLNSKDVALFTWLTENDDNSKQNEGCLESLFKGALFYIIAIVLAFFLALVLIFLIGH